MDDIIHSAPQRPWVISLIVLAALFVYPPVVSSSLLFLSLCLCFSSLTFSFHLHVLEHQGSAAGSAPSMQRTQRSRGLAVPDTARKAVPDTARKLRVILHYFHR